MTSTFSFAAIQAYALQFYCVAIRSEVSQGLTKYLKKQDNTKFCAELFALACYIRWCANIHWLI